MQLTAELNGRVHHINLRRADTTVDAEIDGRLYKGSAVSVDKDDYLLIIDGRTYECRVQMNRTRSQAVGVQIDGESYSVSLVDPRRLRGSNDSLGHKDGGTAEICSPMAGKVVRVLVDVGAQVKPGDGIIVVEAMKMQNELKSPFDGVVREIRAKAGSTVNAGEVLAVIA